MDDFKDLCGLAIEYAEPRLSELSPNALYLRYRKWKEGKPLINPEGYLFDDFLNDLVWNLGRSGLKGRDRDIFEENCYLSIKFI